MALELIRQITELPQSVALLPADVATLLALAHFGNLSEGGKAWPSVQSLSAVSRVSARSLERSFLRLEAAGLLRRERRYNRSTIYHLDRLFSMHLESRTRQNGAYEGRTRQNGAYVPDISASVPAISASVPAISASVPAKMAAYPLKDPLKDPVNNPSERRTVKNDRPEPGTRRPSAGGSCEGAAIAAPPGTPRPSAGGGSTAKPSVLHVSADLSPRRSLRDAHPDLPPSNVKRQLLGLLGDGFGRMPK